MSAAQVLDEMIRQVQEGRTPPLLEEFLQHEGRQPGWLQKLLTPDQALSRRVTRVAPFADGGFFRTCRVFEVTVEGHWLEGVILPGGGTFGLFALCPGGLRYLQGRPEELSALLWEEGRPLHEADASSLAALHAEALLRRKNDAHEVLRDPDALPRHRYQGHPYTLDEAQWEAARPALCAPAVEPEEQAPGGWRLRYCSLFGWMHDKRQLLRHEVRVSADYHIQAQSRLLSRAVFSAVPDLRY